MTEAAKKTATDRYRNSLLAKTAIAVKQLGIDDDTFRDLLESKFGKRSRTKLGNDQLVELIAHFKERGFKPQSKKKGPPRAGRLPLAEGDEAGKARALWLDLYHLGIISDPSEKALAAFVKKQTKVDALRFVRDWFPVIEALKKWATRVCDVDWSGYQVAEGGGNFRTEYKPKIRVIEAQWRQLTKLGAIRIAGPYSCDAWVRSALDIARFQPIYQLTDEQADRVIEMLGNWIRKEMAKAEKSS